MREQVKREVVNDAVRRAEASPLPGPGRGRRRRLVEWPESALRSSLRIHSARNGSAIR